MRALVTVAALATSVVLTVNAFSADYIGFWDEKRSGANSFNRLPPSDAYFSALSGYGASWVRLSYDKWKPAQRDFLIGNADAYVSLQEQDLATLKATLDRAHRAGLKVVLSPLTLPLSRWSQNNDGQFDDRIWQSTESWQASVRFWRDLATALKDHPAIAAYNIVNEPAPEKKSSLKEHATADARQTWYEREKGGGRDLFLFYETVIAAIRTVDPLTPVMVDSGWYAAADAFSYWPAPLTDKRVLYSFHMYEPYAATSAPNLKREHPYTYPGTVPFGGQDEMWNAQRVKDYLAIPANWAIAKNIPASRMVLGEFGCVRFLDDCTRYLEDVLQPTDQAGFHWAFYSFREDNWDAMDYELGKDKVHWHYWKALEENAPDPIRRNATPEFEPIRKRLAHPEN